MSKRTKLKELQHKDIFVHGGSSTVHSFCNSIDAFVLILNQDVKLEKSKKTKQKKKYTTHFIITQLFHNFCPVSDDN